MRVAINPDESFSELLSRVQQTVVDAFSHEVPFEKLVEDLKPERDPSRSPFFQTMFTAQHGAAKLPPMAGVEVTELTEVAWTSAKFDLSVFLNENNGRITVGVEYNIDLFDAATIETMLSQLTAIFQAVVENADISIAALGSLIPKFHKNEEPIEQLMQRLQSIGLRLSVESGRLKVNAPKGVMDDPVKSEIATRRDEIITLLTSSGREHCNGIQAVIAANWTNATVAAFSRATSVLVCRSFRTRAGSAQRHSRFETGRNCGPSHASSRP